MVLPNLIHKIPITILKIDTTETIYDETHREQIQQSITTQYENVPGQPKWFGEEQLIDIGGRKVKATGYILFRYFDLNKRGIEIKFNDRFSKIGKVNCLVFVVGITPDGHYPDQGGATMFKAFFNDKQPTTNGFDL